MRPAHHQQPAIERESYDDRRLRPGPAVCIPACSEREADEGHPHGNDEDEPTARTERPPDGSAHPGAAGARGCGPRSEPRADARLRCRRLGVRRAGFRTPRRCLPPRALPSASTRRDRSRWRPATRVAAEANAGRTSSGRVPPRLEQGLGDGAATGTSEHSDLLEHARPRVARTRAAARSPSARSPAMTIPQPMAALTKAGIGAPKVMNPRASPRAAAIAGRTNAAPSRGSARARAARSFDRGARVAARASRTRVLEYTRCAPYAAKQATKAAPVTPSRPVMPSAPRGQPAPTARDRQSGGRCARGGRPST